MESSLVGLSLNVGSDAISGQMVSELSPQGESKGHLQGRKDLCFPYIGRKKDFQLKPGQWVH